MNYCIFRMEKLKSSSDVCNILKEQHRSEDYESERADPEKSYLNSYSDNFENTFEKFQNLLPKKRRKNAVVGLNFLVTTSEEFENPEDEKKYYEEARNFISKNFGEVVGWAIHRDETSTHMQAVTIPLVEGKLNARELVGGAKNRMREFQNSFFKEVGKPFGLLRGVEGSKAVHKTVEQKHREESEEIRKQKEEILKQKESARRIWEKISQAQKEFEQQKIEFQKKENDLKNREKNISVTEKKNEELYQKLTEKGKSVAEREKQLIEENNRLVLEKQWIDNSAKAADEILEKGKITSDTPLGTVVTMCRQLAQKVMQLTQQVKKVLDAPLEKVEEYCREARKSGKKTLREFLFPKIKFKNQRVNSENDINTRKNGKSR